MQEVLRRGRGMLGLVTLGTAEIYEALLAVPILLAVFFGLRNWRRHRTETRDWLSGKDVRNSSD